MYRSTPIGMVQTDDSVALISTDLAIEMEGEHSGSSLAFMAVFSNEGPNDAADVTGEITIASNVGQFTTVKIALRDAKIRTNF